MVYSNSRKSELVVSYKMSLLLEIIKKPVWHVLLFAQSFYFYLRIWFSKFPRRFYMVWYDFTSRSFHPVKYFFYPAVGKNFLLVILCCMFSCLTLLETFNLQNKVKILVLSQNEEIGNNFTHSSHLLHLRIQIFKEL